MIAFPTDPLPSRTSAALAEPAPLHDFTATPLAELAADAYRVASDIAADLPDGDVRALRLLDALWDIGPRGEPPQCARWGI